MSSRTRCSGWVCMGILSLTLFSVALPLKAGDKTDLEKKLETLAEKKRDKVLAIAEKTKGAINLVEVVLSIKMSQGGRQAPPQERKVRVNGTTLTADGVTVLSNAMLNPAARFAQRGGMQIDTSVVSAKIISDDGSEIPVKIVLKDEDLDLAFVRPTEAEDTFSHVTLNKDVAPKLLDPVMTIERLDQSASRAPVIRTGTIGGTIEKPRRCWVGPDVVPGLPALDKDGVCYGLFLLRVSSQGRPRVVIRPAEEILEVMAQIPPRDDEKEGE